MIKTSKQIETDFYRFLLPIEEVISGKVYRDGLRPRNSAKEDAVVIFTTGLSEQVQTGIITINVFVPDLPNHDKNCGVWVENGLRCQVIEEWLQNWIVTNNFNNYFVTLTNTIHTQKDYDSINQHFVVCQIKYKYFD